MAGGAPRPSGLENGENQGQGNWYSVLGIFVISSFLRNRE
jgi:hypothetical protein